jgi:hypothetical protein
LPSATRGAADAGSPADRWDSGAAPPHAVMTTRHAHSKTIVVRERWTLRMKKLPFDSTRRWMAPE